MQQKIKDEFRYDGKNLFWKNRGPKRRLDRPAGNKNKISGYRQIRIDGKLHYEHRLVWIMTNGDISKGMEIDHIDGDRSNNSITNLRAGTHQQNCVNVQTRTCESKTSKYRGVYFNAGKWQSRISVNKKHINLGRFICPVEAFCAYKKASLKFHGEWSRINSYVLGV